MKFVYPLIFSVKRKVTRKTMRELTDAAHGNLVNYCYLGILVSFVAYILFIAIVRRKDQGHSRDSGNSNREESDGEGVATPTNASILFRIASKSAVRLRSSASVNMVADPSDSQRR